MTRSRRHLEALALLAAPEHHSASTLAVARMLVDCLDVRKAGLQALVALWPAYQLYKRLAGHDVFQVYRGKIRRESQILVNRKFGLRTMEHLFEARKSIDHNYTTIDLLQHKLDAYMRIECADAARLGALYACLVAAAHTPDLLPEAIAHYPDFWSLDPKDVSEILLWKQLRAAAPQRQYSQNSQNQSQSQSQNRPHHPLHQNPEVAPTQQVHPTQPAPSSQPVALPTPIPHHAYVRKQQYCQA